MKLTKDFAFKGTSEATQQFDVVARSKTVAKAITNPLGPLSLLVGTWKGTGFNQIWRPSKITSGGQDRFLQLNKTKEVLVFEDIGGDIPNRGLLQDDINLHGITYLQQVQDVNVLGSNGKPSGIHIEPGIWLRVPPTTNPSDPETVARLANIPHGTSMTAQGTAIIIRIWFYG